MVKKSGVRHIIAGKGFYEDKRQLVARELTPDTVQQQNSVNNIIKLIITRFGALLP